MNAYKQHGFDGPSGIYYDAKHNEIFILKKIYPMRKWASIKDGIIKGFYHGWVYSVDTYEGKSANVSLQGMDYCTKIGDL